MEEVSFGVSSVLDLAFWALLFWLATFGLELFVTLRCRGVLQAAQRPAGRPTLLMVLALVVVAPFVAGFAACNWSVHRSAADALERIDPSTGLEWAIEHGADRVREDLELAAVDDATLELEKLRALARDRKAATDDSITELFEHLWWTAVDHELERAVPEPLTLNGLITLVERQLKEKVRDKLGDYAAEVRASGRRWLYLLVGFLVLANGVTIVLVRRAAAGPTPITT